MYFHFHSILTTGYSLSDTLDLYIHNLQCIQSIAKGGAKAALKKCFQGNINDLKDATKMGVTERVKDVKERVQQVMREMDELKEFIIDIEEKVFKLLGELESTAEEVPFPDAENIAWDMVGALLRNK